MFFFYHVTFATEPILLLIKQKCSSMCNKSYNEFSRRESSFPPSSQCHGEPAECVGVSPGRRQSDAEVEGKRTKSQLFLDRLHQQENMFNVILLRENMDIFSSSVL